MAKRLFLASFDYLRPKDPDVSLAASSILAHLKTQFGSSSGLDIFHRQYDVRRADGHHINQKFLTDLHDLKPDVLATGIYVWNENYIKSAIGGILPDLKSRLITVLGGPQITYNPKGTLEPNYPYGDIFIRGYAEQSLADVISGIISGNDARNIEGVHYRGEVDLGLKSKYDLASLPSPLLTPGVLNHKGYIRLETKRGCPFTCAFCQHKDSYEKRLACELARIKEEVKAIVAQEITDVSIVDPIFNSGTGYQNVLQEFLDNGYQGRLSLQSRFEMVKNDYLELCTKLLESGVKLELEFGIQTIMPSESKVIRRKNNLKKVVEVAEGLRNREIPFEVSLIYGLPLQNVDSFSSTIEWVAEFLKPDLLHAWPLMLLKGTEMYDLKEEFQLREKYLDEDLEEVDKRRMYAGIPHVVQSSTFTETEWSRMKDIALALLKQ